MNGCVVLSAGAFIKRMILCMLYQICTRFHPPLDTLVSTIEQRIARTHSHTFSAQAKHDTRHTVRQLEGIKKLVIKRYVVDVCMNEVYMVRIYLHVHKQANAHPTTIYNICIHAFCLKPASYLFRKS